LSTQVSPAFDAWVHLLRGHAGMRRLLSAQLHADHELTINEYETLLLLSRAEENQMRHGDLAESLQLTPSGVTRLLDGMRDRGFVEKATCSRDARVTYAVLAGAGWSKLEEASSSHVAAVLALFQERFTSTEIETLKELLGRLPGAGGGATSCTV
jgi:DNA-binding MarR family transcriptional regulator